jgi:predicted transcriptional regulator
MEGWYFRALCIWMSSPRRNGPPTIMEFAVWLDKSRTAAYSALCALEHKGWVTRVSDTDRRFIPVPGL